MTVTACGEKFEVTLKTRRRVESREEAERLERLLLEARAAAVRQFRNGDRPCISVPEGLEDFLDHQRVIRANGPATVARYAARLGRFAAAWGETPLVDITREMVCAWQRQRLADPGRRRLYHPDSRVSRDTVNQELKALRRFASWARSLGRAPETLEFMSVPLLTVRGKTCDNRFVPRARPRRDFRRLVMALDKSGHECLSYVLRGMLLFVLREEALFRLTPRHVTWPTRESGGQVEIPPLKGGVEGACPVSHGDRKHGLLRDLVRYWRRVHGRRPRRDEPLFISRRGRSRKRPLGWSTDAFDHELRRVCDKLGYRDFTAYQARHSVLSWMQRQPGVSLADIQAAARHLRISTQEVYTHRSGAEGRPAYEAAERFLSRTPDNDSCGGGSCGPSETRVGEVLTLQIPAGA